MDMTSLLSLTAFAVFTAFTPGPNNMMLAASGVNFGLARTWPHILGITFGFTALCIAGGIGLGSLFAALPLLYEVIRVLAFCFLAYIVWKIATAAPAHINPAARPMGFWAAAAFQWMNPKGVSVVISAMTAYMSGAENLVLRLTIIVFIFMVMTLLSTIAWAWFGTVIARFLSDPRHYRMFSWSMAALLTASLLPVLISG